MQMLTFTLQMPTLGQMTPTRGDRSPAITLRNRVRLALITTSVRQGQSCYQHLQNVCLYPSAAQYLMPGGHLFATLCKHTTFVSLLFSYLLFRYHQSLEITAFPQLQKIMWVGTHLIKITI